MFKFVKLGLFAFFMAFFSGFMVCGESSADTTITSEGYVKYLTERGKNESEALRVRDKFQKLSDAIKKKFIYYISNHQITKEILQTEVAENSSKTLYGGDIVITRKTRTVILNEVDDVEESPSLFDVISSILVTPAYAAGNI